MMKKFFIFNIIFISIFMLFGCKNKELNIKIKDINKYGNVYLDSTFSYFNENNLEIGDIITIKIASNQYDMPICTEYSDVNSKMMVCRFDLEDNHITLAINMGDFASTTNLGTKEQITDEPGYKWDIKQDTIKISLKEKKGYLDEYEARHLVRTNNREDYPNLTDLEYSNYRMVNIGKIKSGILYRSSSPINDNLNRATYIMSEIERVGINTIINLVDSVEAMEEFPSYNNSYYSKCQIYNAQMIYDFNSDDFKLSLLGCLKFIEDNKGPYLIHCQEGKDRTGIVIAIIEIMMDAEIEDVLNDYMVTYYNFYNVNKDDKKYDIILNNNIISTLKQMLNISDLEDKNIYNNMHSYLLNIGLTDDDINIIKSNLS